MEVNDSKRSTYHKAAFSKCVLALPVSFVLLCLFLFLTSAWGAACGISFDKSVEDDAVVLRWESLFPVFILE